jgi:hypothetical protein
LIIEPTLAPPADMRGKPMIDYSIFKSLQILLFWGAVIGFCVWQLRAVQRMRRQRAAVKQDQPAARHPSASGEQRSQ